MGLVTKEKDEKVKEGKVKETEATVKENDIIDLSIPEVQKTRFRINGDNDKILELDTADPNILARLNKGYKDLIKLAEKMSSLDYEGEGEEANSKLAQALEDLDNQMKERLDYIFDANVGKVLAGNTSMYSIKDGKFRFETVIETIGNLYEKGFNKEFEAMRKRMGKHTSKYIK